MAEKRGWLTNPATGEKFHAWSHVKSIFYNKASNILLKDKLDEMDKLIDEKIKKTMMSNVQVNDQNKVPTSALVYTMQQSITNNKDAVDQLNRDMKSRLSEAVIVGGAIADTTTGIYTVHNPTDAWGEGYYLVINSMDAVIALNLNTGKMQYRAAGGVGQLERIKSNALP